MAIAPKVNPKKRTPVAPGGIGNNARNNLAKFTTPTDVSSEARRREILGEVKKLRLAQGALNSKQFSSFNDNQNKKRDSQGMFFQAMADAGVDLNDPASISEFLQNLEQTNPDLAILFEQAFQQLFGEGEPLDSSQFTPKQQPKQMSPRQQPGQPSGLMDKFSNLQQTMLRQ